MKDDYQDDERFFKKVQFLPTKENERVGWLKKSMFFFGLTKIPLFCRVKRDFWGGSAFLWRFGRRCQADPRLGHHRCGSFGVMCQKVWIFHGNCLILSISSYWPPFGTVWVACVSRFHWAKKKHSSHDLYFPIFVRKLQNKELLAIQRMFQLFFFQTCQNIGGTFLLHPRNLTETYRYQKWPYLKPASTGYPRPIILGPSCEVAPIVASWTWWGEPCIETWFVAPKIADIWSSGNIGYHWIFLGIFWLMMVDVFLFFSEKCKFQIFAFFVFEKPKKVRLFLVKH